MLYFRPLFDESSQKDGVFDVVVFAAFETNGDRAVNQIEGTVAFDVAGIAAHLESQLIAVRMTDVGYRRSYGIRPRIDLKVSHCDPNCVDVGVARK